MIFVDALVDGMRVDLKEVWRLPDVLVGGRGLLGTAAEVLG